MVHVVTSIHRVQVHVTANTPTHVISSTTTVHAFNSFQIPLDPRVGVCPAQPDPPRDEGSPSSDHPYSVPSSLSLPLCPTPRHRSAGLPSTLRGAEGNACHHGLPTLPASRLHPLSAYTTSSCGRTRIGQDKSIQAILEGQFERRID